MNKQGVTHMGGHNLIGLRRALVTYSSWQYLLNKSSLINKSYLTIA